jgi:hypothetical protein
MDTKTSKTLSIIAAGVIFIAFFMPWTKSMFGSSTSAWEIIEQMFSLLVSSEKMPADIRAYIPFTLVGIPISALLIIVQNVKSMWGFNNSQLYGLVIIILSFSTLFISEFNNDFLTYFSVVLILWSFGIIFLDYKTIGNKNGVAIDNSKAGKIVIISVFSLMIISLIYLQVKNPFSEFTNILNILNYGFYLTLLISVYFLIDILVLNKKISY